MRKFLTAAVAALTLIGAVPALAADDLSGKTWDQIMTQAKAEGQVTFFSWWGEEWWRTAAQKFQDQTGIKVTVVIGDSAPTLDKMLAEKENPAGSIDVLHFGGAQTKVVIDGHLLMPNLSAVLPDSDKLDPKLSAIQEGVPVKGFVAPIYRNQTAFLYDPARVPNPPQTWDDLQAFIKNNPGQLAFSDPTKGGTGEAFVTAAIANVLKDPHRYDGDTDVVPSKVTDWSKVWDWFNSIKDNVVITNSNSDAAERLNQGEVSLVVAWDDDTTVALKKGTLSKNFKVYIPEFGLPGGGDTLGVVANSPHKAAAVAWIAFLTSPEIQKQMNATIGSYVSRTDITGESELIPQEQRVKYSTSWLPAPYTNYADQQFVANVLQH